MSRKTSAERAETFQQFFAIGPANDAGLARIYEKNLNVVPFLERKGIDHR